jgi:hypothetical protein
VTVAYDIATAAVGGLMVGNELVISAFVHPQLLKLDKGPYAQTAARVASVLGKVMPFGWGIVLYLSSAQPVSSGAGLFILLAAILWAVAIVFSITMLVPINNRIEKMDPEHPTIAACRTDAAGISYHVRVVVLILALFLLLTGLFAGTATQSI